MRKEPREAVRMCVVCVSGNRHKPLRIYGTVADTSLVNKRVRVVNGTRSRMCDARNLIVIGSQPNGATCRKDCCVHMTDEGCQKALMRVPV